MLCLLPIFIYLYFDYCCVLKLTCRDTTRCFLLGYYTHLFILVCWALAAYGLVSSFFETLRGVVSIYFLFKSFRIMDLKLTRVDRNSFDLEIRWTKFRDVTIKLISTSTLILGTFSCQNINLMKLFNLDHLFTNFIISNIRLT